MANTLCFSTYQSPIGELLLTSDGRAMTGLYPATHRAPPLDSGVRDDAFFTGVRDQLKAYFAGRLEAFDIEQAPIGTPFQHRVWDALRAIPYGAQWSYGALATLLGKASASRAVGLANGKNPLSIIVPCHRVIGANGMLTGYSGGLELKRWLLDHEATYRNGRPTMFFEPRFSAPVRFSA
jgi:methylated-DNA-[protein]-cysteine S-methyltransferase